MGQGIWELVEVRAPAFVGCKEASPEDCIATVMCCVFGGPAMATDPPHVVVGVEGCDQG